MALPTVGNIWIDIGPGPLNIGVRNGGLLWYPGGAAPTDEEEARILVGNYNGTMTWADYGGTQNVWIRSRSTNPIGYSLINS